MAYEMRISDWSSDVCSSDLFSARFHRIDVRAKKLFDVGLGHLESSLFSFVEFLLQFREFFVLLLKIDQSLETFGSRAGEKVLDAPVSEICELRNPRMATSGL